MPYNHKHIMNNLSKFGFEIHVLLYHILSNSFLKIVFFSKIQSEMELTEFRQDIVASVCDVTEDGERHW